MSEIRYFFVVVLILAVFGVYVAHGGEEKPKPPGVLEAAAVASTSTTGFGWSKPHWCVSLRGVSQSVGTEPARTCARCALVLPKDEHYSGEITLSGDDGAVFFEGCMWCLRDLCRSAPKGK